jgi:hypothetical protein
MATVEVVATTRRAGVQVLYRFGGAGAEWVRESKYVATAKQYAVRVQAVGIKQALMEGLEVDVWAPDAANATLHLDPVSMNGILPTHLGPSHVIILT